MSVTTTEALRARGLEIINILCVDKVWDKMASVMAPNVEAYHDDGEALVGRDHFISHWQKAASALPDMAYHVYDLVAELDKVGKGGKVWVFSRITGLPRGIQKDTIDMFDIDGNGQLVKTKDVQRAIAQ